MGIILKTQMDENSYLTNYGFKKDEPYIYSRWYRLSSLYDMLVTVNILTEHVKFYIEYNCGGEVALADIFWTDEHVVVEDEKSFIEWLDKEATRFAEVYM